MSLKTDADMSKPLVLFNCLKEYLTEYLASRRAEKTKENYQVILSAFIDFLSSSSSRRIDKLSFLDFSKESIEAFIRSLIQNNKVANSTANHYLTCIRTFLRFAASRHIMLNSLYLEAKSMEPMKVRKSQVVRFMSAEAVKAILHQPDTRTRKGYRDLVYMMFLYDTGCRNAEALGMCLQDICLRKDNSSTVLVHGKGDKTRMVPLSEKMALRLQDYIDRFHAASSPESPLFFRESRDGYRTRMTHDIVKDFMDRYAESARLICPDVPDKVTPHMFRHSRAMHLYENGMPLVMVAQLLGHSNLETTLIYASASMKMKRQAIEKATQANNPLLLEKEKERVPKVDEIEFKRLFGLK
jgi:integrase/recombinase XerD